jgi:hypothetical protein
VGRLTSLVAVPVLVLVLAACDPVGSAAPIAEPPRRPALPWTQVTSAAVRYEPPQTRDQDEPAPSPPPRPAGPLPSAPAASPPAGPVLGPCLPLYGPGTPVPVHITTAPGPTVITWFHNGDLATTAYWVGVQPQAGTSKQQSTLTWTRVAPPVGCQDVSFGVPGLTAGTPYLLWLDADSLTPETGSGSTRHTLAGATVTPA